ncbi:MAG: hypothetical protein ABFC31_00105 [Clostridiaceae bacterium]
MENKAVRRIKRWVFPLCLGCAAVFLLLCTKSSPLYPLNDWVDANIYFTIGKGMMHGQAPYLNLYDQKGPTAYLIYGLASLISGTSFLGVYLLEVLAFGAFLFAMVKIVSLFAEKGALIVLPVFCWTILGSLSFSHGGSFEEFMMPLFAFSLYDSLNYFKNIYPKPVPYKTIALNALLAGLMLYGKFTLLAFYIAWMGTIAISQLIAKQWKRALGASFLFVLIMVGVGIPWAIYFSAHGALDEFWYYYFYQNIFGYSYLEAPLILTMPLAIVHDVAAFSFRNPQIAGFIALGLIWFVLQKRDQVKTVEKINLILLCALLTAGIYCGGQGYRYYGLVLTPFMALGFVPLIRFWNERVSGRIPARALKAALFGALTLGMLALAFVTTDNRYMLLKKKQEMPQTQFAETLQASGEAYDSLFCYGFPDSGFYLAANVIPEYRFFATSNVALEDVRTEQARYVDESMPKFIITRDNELEKTGYELIDASEFRYEERDRIYRLYERMD